MKDPQEDPMAVQCFCVCVVGVHYWEISLGYTGPWNVIFCLSCRFILGFSCAYSLSLGRVSFCVVVLYYMFICGVCCSV